MRSFISLTLAVLAAVELSYAASSGCGKAAPSSGTKSMTVNGKNRQYILQLPNTYDASKPHKLVFGYHWRDGSMNTVAQANFYALRPLAGDSTIFIAPNGLNAGWANSGGEDIKFTDQMLDFAKTNLCIDEKQVFATGWSYGGSMSHSVACSRPKDFRAVAVIAGAQLSGCDGGTTPVPYLGIHGSADNVLPIDLGHQLRDKWLGLNGCQSKSAPEPSPGAGNHIKTTYTCSKAPVTWIAHGGGHVPDPSDSNGNKWAQGETWDFFTKVVAGDGGGSTTAPTTTGGSMPTTSQGSTPTTTQPPATTQPPTGSCAAIYGQCGGSGYSGPTCCSQGTCKFSNDWYSQCL